MDVKFPSEVQEIIDTIEAHDFSVDLYEENGKVCGAEIESWTDGGVDMLHFIDLRGKDINDPEDWKEEIASIAFDFDIDEEIDVHRQDKSYCDAFTCRASVQDFEDWQERLRLLAQAVLYPEIEEGNRATTIVAVMSIEKMPENCDECPLSELSALDYCRCPVIDGEYRIETLCGRPLECPLKEAVANVLQP